MSQAELECSANDAKISLKKMEEKHVEQQTNPA